MNHLHGEGSWARVEKEEEMQRRSSANYTDQMGGGKR